MRVENGETKIENGMSYEGAMPVFKLSASEELIEKLKERGSAPSEMLSTFLETHGISSLEWLWAQRIVANSFELPDADLLWPGDIVADPPLRIDSSGVLIRMAALGFSPRVAASIIRGVRRTSSIATVGDIAKAASSQRESQLPEPGE